MLKTLLILILFLNTNLYSDVDPKWYHDNEYSFGKIKSIDCSEYEVKQNFDKLLIDKCILRVQFEFDINENETKFIISDCNNKYIDYVESLFKYDKYGNITYKKEQIKVYSRDYRFENPSTSIKSFEYLYNSSKQIILKKTLNESKELEETIKYVYDESNNIKEEVHYDYLNDKIIIYKYNYLNNLLISRFDSLINNAKIKKNQSMKEISNNEIKDIWMKSEMKKNFNQDSLLQIFEELDEMEYCDYSLILY